MSGVGDTSSTGNDYTTTDTTTTDTDTDTDTSTTTTSSTGTTTTTTSTTTVDTPGGISFNDAVTALTTSSGQESLLSDGASTMTTESTDDVSEDVEASDDVNDEVVEETETDETTKKTEDFSDANASSDGMSGDTGSGGGSSGGGSGSGSGTGSDGGTSSGDTESTTVTTTVTTDSVETDSPSLDTTGSDITTDSVPEGSVQIVEKPPDASGDTLDLSATSDASSTEKAVDDGSGFKLFSEKFHMRMSNSLDAEIATEIALYKQHKVNRDYQSKRKQFMLKAREYSKNVSIYLSGVKGITLSVNKGHYSFSNDLVPNKYTADYKAYLASVQAQTTALQNASANYDDAAYNLNSDQALLAEYQSAQNESDTLNNGIVDDYDNVVDNSGSADKNLSKGINEDLPNSTKDLETLIESLQGEDDASTDPTASVIANLQTLHTQLTTQEDNLPTLRNEYNSNNSDIDDTQKDIENLQNDIANKQQQISETTDQDKIDDLNNEISDDQTQLTTDQNTLSSQLNTESTLRSQINSGLDQVLQIKSEITAQWNQLSTTTQTDVQSHYSQLTSSLDSFTTRKNTYDSLNEQERGSLETFYNDAKTNLNNTLTVYNEYSSITSGQIAGVQTKLDTIDAMGSSPSLEYMRYYAGQLRGSAHDDLKKGRPYTDNINDLNSAIATDQQQMADAQSTLDTTTLPTPPADKYTSEPTDYGLALDNLNLMILTLKSVSSTEIAPATKLARTLYAAPAEVNASGITSWWNSYRRFTHDVREESQTIQNTKTAMKACVAGAAFSFGATMAAEAALLIAYEVEEKQRDTYESQQQGALSAYYSVVSQCKNQQVSRNTMWRDEIGTYETKTETKLLHMEQKIEHKLKKEEKAMKHNQENIQKISDLIHHITNKRKGAHTQSYM